MDKHALEYYVNMTRWTAQDAIDFGGLKAERFMEIGYVWSPPVLGRDEGGILYDPGNRKKLRPVPELSVKFADLITATDDEVFHFANKWGALGIGEDGWPPSSGSHLGRESFSWRLLASRFRALINLGAAFNTDQPGQEQDWQALDDDKSGRFTFFKPWLKVSDQSLSRTEIMSFMRTLIQRFGVAPRFWWNESVKQWQIDLDAYALSNLPGLIIIQLMLIIANRSGWAICSECRRSYPVERRPDPTRRNYCNESP